MLMILIGMLLVCVGSGFWISQQLPLPIFNFMLLGMGFSAAFCQLYSTKQIGSDYEIYKSCNSFFSCDCDLNLGAPLDYHLI